MIVTPVKVKAYAHCRNPMCPGYGQEQVDGVRTTVEYTYGDNGADMFKSMVERSTVTHDFVNDADRPCRHCGGDRELTDQARPTYQALSGYDPMGLVNGEAGAFNPNVVNTEADARVAALEAQIRLQGEQLKALLDAVTEAPGTEA